MIAALRFEAARRHPWLRAASYHTEMVRQSLADPEIAADVVIGPDDSAMDRPDVLISGRYPIDVIPDTPASRQAHRERPYIEHDDQLMAYRPATPEFLAEIFEPTPSQSGGTHGE